MIKMNRILQVATWPPETVALQASRDNRSKYFKEKVWDKYQSYLGNQ